MAEDIFGNEVRINAFLRDLHIEPPFSVLDSKGGEWQKRKKMWKPTTDFPPISSRQEKNILHNYWGGREGQ